MNVNEYIGLKYGRLTIQSFSHKDKYYHVFVNCQCECGNTKTLRLNNLINGIAKSCGCLKSESSKKNISKLIENKDYINTTHGQTGTRLYSIYRNMKRRCYNSNTDSYINYGARGIKICDEWLNDFNSFYEWAYNNGYNDTLTIERINNSGDYEPNNCRWISRGEQANNRRNTTYITYKGKTQSMKQWANELGIKYHMLQYRITKRNMTIEEALKDLGR
ncbi:hypothetical protein [Staphylococcus phage vB_SsapH-Golestan-105-M]|nr:hypothetical protein [Staphylococcus phage vB_SsapH-Golestan-105-M]